MAQTFEFFDERAKEAAVEAENATLENVRERNLRAEKTWRTLANQARKVVEDRATAERERAERRADEAAEAAQVAAFEAAEAEAYEASK